MRLLLTNDDGIYAPGIKALRQVLEKEGQYEITVVAPDREKSATGHGITVHRPLRAFDIKFKNSNVRGVAVDGTPADCVKLAVEALLENPPDLVLSGINSGPNLGTDVLYSGTVSAAIEAMINGIPAIAISMGSFAFEDEEYLRAAEIFARLLPEILKHPWPRDTILNINIPNVSKEEIKGVAITRLGVRKYINVFEERKDPRGLSYYWMSGEAVNYENGQDTDTAALARKEITITPVHFDLTNYHYLKELKTWVKALEGALAIG